MEYIKKVAYWWRMTGKLYLLYGLLLYVVASPFLKQVPILVSVLPDDKYSTPMIAACLFLIIQILMSFITGADKEVALIKIEEYDNFEKFKTRLKAARRVDILCSTSETFYPVLKEVFGSQKIECRMLLRHPHQNNVKQRNGILHYTDSYNEVVNSNTACTFVVRYCKNTFSRIVIIDSSEVYFGFYKLDNGRLRARGIEMIHARSGTHFGNLILDIASNRFQSIWDTADEAIGTREQLVY